jgi:hypothetical protein
MRHGWSAKVAQAPVWNKIYVNDSEKSEWRWVVYDADLQEIE